MSSNLPAIFESYVFLVKIYAISLDYLTNYPFRYTKYDITLFGKPYNLISIHV